MTEERKPFVALEFPPWLRWGQRKGAFIDNGALAIVYPNHRHSQRVAHPEGGYRFERVGAVYHCGWCGNPCPGRRTAWCSDECSNRFYRVWSWGHLSAYIIERDDERCTRCRAEHAGWRHTPARIVHRAWNDGGPLCDVEACPLDGFAWEVDHIVPVKDGGTDDPANLRLVCHDCHVAVGYEQRRARKAKIAPELALTGTEGR